MTINVPGLVSIVTFYLLILVVGIWAGWKNRGKGSQGGTEQVMLAGRDMGTFVGILTMTATWVGGGYVIGSAEGAFTSGVVWCQAPFGFGLSLIVAGLFFANPMRSAGYHTMLDPFQEKYGAKIGGLLFLPALCGEILWSSAILSALGSTLSVILGLDNTISVVVSAAVAMLYTLFGGLHSVAYTDVVQVFCIAIGLTICVPFAWTHKAVDTKALTIAGAWEGVIEIYNVGVYIENYLLIVIGGIPWQVYFQRVLACRTPKQAQTISYLAGLGAILLAAPPIFLGVIARVTDWNAATHGTINVTVEEHGKMILPLMLQFLTPPWVSFIGLGAISAAVMSSADSSILSSSSMFARNIYQAIFFTDASERHVLRVMWVAIVIVAALASLMALTVNSIYGLFLLSADLVYVLLFPQLLLILYWNEYCNSYGCIASFLTGFLFRILGGEPLIGLPAILAYPFYDRNLGQLFPFKTMSMIISLMSHVIVSLSSRWIFLNNWLPPSWDLLQCFDCPVNCTAVGSIHQSVTVATISQLSDPRRKSHDGSINAQHQNLDMGRMYIPRPKLRRNSAHGIYRRPDSLSTSSQREPRNH
uniref:High-affinity choline transporter 1 n=1 Tax=Daphnia galeata TaxID=27404 RepID=A0A8J2R9R4_9CRUS|nr:unnamed protein product [Daphnia galeata]